MAAIKVDLPALGYPTRPTSAKSFSSSWSQCSSPGVPGSQRVGTRLVGVAKRALPRPPQPPIATIAAVGATAGDVLLPAEAPHAVPAIPRLHVNLDLINKIHSLSSPIAGLTT